MHSLKVATYDKMQKLLNKALQICLQRNNGCSVRKLHKDGNVSWLDRSDINVLNFMYKRQSNSSLLQERPKELRRFEADIFIEHHSDNNTFLIVLYIKPAGK